MSIQSTRRSDLEFGTSQAGDGPRNPIEQTIPQLAVKLKTAGFMIDSGETKVRELIDKGKLDTFLDDGVRKVTVASIHRYIAEKIAANESDRAKTVAAVNASLVLARKRRLEKARQMAAERHARLGAG
jgi:hypothetical protein